MTDTPPDQNLSRIPPPPDDVLVRTMQSDIASLASSGGTIGPQFVPMTGVNADITAKKSDAVMTILIFVVAAIVAVLAIYYFFYSK
jgi:hypothetical protein